MLMDHEIRARFNEAMKAIRKEGIIARMNFMCCGSCAAAEIGTMLETRPEKVGGIHVNRQGWPKPDEDFSVYLSYGAREVKGEPAEIHEAKTRAVGVIVEQALRDAGLRPIWDGSTSQCILVDEAEADKLEEAKLRQFDLGLA